MPGAADDPLAPFDAVLVVSYGGPNAPDDVLPFMRNATRGRGIPDERLVEVSGHYQLFGGKSPINERNAELLDALRAGLAAAGSEVPITIGNRNWHPFIAEALADLVAAGHRRVLVLFTAAFASYSACRQYREDLARAMAETPGAERLQLDKIGPYGETEGYVEANARALVTALTSGDDVLAERARVIFVTHSIPASMDAHSGPGGTEHTWAAQNRRTAARVAEAAGARLGRSLEWELGYCSRSGAPHIPWLEPDINDRLTELAAAGCPAVVAAPVGFINDHMEVVFDLDTQARQTAADLGLGYVRAATAGTDSAFVEALIEALVTRASVARGEQDEPDDARYRCAATCCLQRAGAQPAPTVCGA